MAVVMELFLLQVDNASSEKHKRWKEEILFLFDIIKWKPKEYINEGTLTLYTLSKIWKSIWVYIVIAFYTMRARDGIYKPFKWDNDDITEDLCAQLRSSYRNAHQFRRWRNKTSLTTIQNGIVCVFLYFFPSEAPTHIEFSKKRINKQKLFSQRK